jgi:hypothetical protein
MRSIAQNNYQFHVEPEENRDFEFHCPHFARNSVYTFHVKLRGTGGMGGLLPAWA